MTQQPLDADAVLRDDALLDALGRGELPDDFDDDATARLLLAWRDDVADTAGLPEPHAVPVRSVGVASVGDTRGPRRDLHHLLTRRAAAVAVIAAIGLGSIGSVAAAGVAEPGSPLWPLTKVVYEDRAKSLEAREGALSLLREAKQAAENNDPDQARRLLVDALQEAGAVDDGKDKDKILAEADAVRAQLAELTDPGDPSTTPTPQNPATASPSPAPSTEPSNPPSSPSPSPTPSEPTPGEPPPSTEPTPTPSSEPTSATAPDGANEVTPTT